MLASVNTLVIAGVEALPVKVEVDIHRGLPSFDIVGLASMAIKEARKGCGRRSERKTPATNFLTVVLQLTLPRLTHKKKAQPF